jgi:hypothetical protein
MERAAGQGQYNPLANELDPSSLADLPPPSPTAPILPALARRAGIVGAAAPEHAAIGTPPAPCNDINNHYRELEQLRLEHKQEVDETCALTAIGCFVLGAVVC